MGSAIKRGDVVVVRFPFSDLSSHKNRPSLVLAEAEFGNFILCQITSNPYGSKRAVTLPSSAFKNGQLPLKSYIRPDKLFTTDPQIIQKKIGELKPSKMREVGKSLSEIFAL